MDVIIHCRESNPAPEHLLPACSVCTVDKICSANIDYYSIKRNKECQVLKVCVLPAICLLFHIHSSGSSLQMDCPVLHFQEVL